MRWDMNEVIVEVARSGGEGKRGDKFFKQRYGEDREEFGGRQPMGPGWNPDRKNQGDKLQPLRRFLRSRVGRQWDEVFSEICEVNDKRSMLGFHLLTHLAQMVEAHGIKNRSQHFPEDFYEDQNGVLRERHKERTYWARHRKQRANAPIERILLSDGWRYQWLEGFWYRMKEEEVPDGLIPEKKDENGIVIQKARVVTRTQYHKFQCGRKELKQIREFVVRQRQG